MRLRSQKARAVTRGAVRCSAWLGVSGRISKALNILGHEAVLTVSVANVARANVGIGEEMPDLVLCWERGEVVLQSVLNWSTLRIPLLDIGRRNERQRHESLQLGCEILSGRCGLGKVERCQARPTA